MNVVEVWAQADVLPVRMTLIPGSQAGTLETLFLKAIRAGADRAEDLGDIFGLAPRMVEGLLGDLWRANRISIDLGTDNDRIFLTSVGQKDLDALKAGQSVESGAQRSTSEDVAHERLTGRVLPIQDTFRYPRDRRLVVPAMLDDPQPADLTEVELAQALTAALRKRAGGDLDRLGDFKVGAAYLTPALLQVSRKRQYVPLRVVAAEDAAGRLAVQMVDDHLPMRARELAAKRLQRLIEDQPTSSFVAHLRSRAQKTPLVTHTVRQVVDELIRAVDGLEECPPANRQRVHDRVSALAAQADAYIRALARTEMDVQVVRTAEQHRTRINAMLGDAQRQLVIAVPWLRSRGVEGIRAALLAAVRRGVQVTILWGISADEEKLDEVVLAAFDEVQRNAQAAGRGGALRYHRERGARIHAKVVVADDRQLLLTSKNFLSGSNHEELGLVLTALPDQICPAIEEVLQFLYDHTPDPATAFQLIRARGAFGPRQETEVRSAAQPPRLTATILSQNAPAEHIRAWAVAWQEAARSLAARVTRSRPTVEIIQDGLHGPLVREALTSAQRRVLITSDRVTAQALTAEVASLAINRAATGVEVALRFARPSDDEAQDRLRDLAARTGLNGPDVQRRPDMHAKVIVMDEMTVLGSFNHLSVNAGLRRRHATGELSVRVASGPVTDAVWSSIIGGTAGSVTVGLVPEAAPDEPQPEILGGLAQRLLDVLQPETGRPNVDAIVSLVATQGSARVLSVVRNFALGPAAEQRVLAAAVLGILDVRAADGPEDAMAENAMVRELLGSVWAEGAWACADQLRESLADPSISPRGVLTRTLAASGNRAAALLPLATGDVPCGAREAAVLLVSTCASLLLGDLDDPQLVDILRSWDHAVPDRIGSFVDHALDYWSRYGPLPREIPGIAEVPSGKQDVPSLWASLDAALESLQRYDSHSDYGKAVLAYLFGPAGEMAELAAILKSRSGTGLQAWQADHSDSNDSRWLDKVTRAANQQVIDTNRRASFTIKRRDIRLAARRLTIALHKEERSGSFLPTRQLEELSALRFLAAEISKRATEEDGSAEAAALAVEAARLGDRLAGRTAGDRMRRGVSLDSWAMPQVRVAISDGAGTLLPALCRDLCARWAPEEAVRFLIDNGEFGLADAAITELSDGGQGEQEELSLRRERAAASAVAEDAFQARVHAARLRYDRAGLQETDDHWQAPVLVRERLKVSLANWDAATEQLDRFVGQRQDKLTAELKRRRNELAPGWADYVAMLIDAEELEVAALALTHRDGKPRLPQQVALARWSWRWPTLPEVALWFDPEYAETPQRVRADFIPDLADTAGRNVISALQSLAISSPQGLEEWVTAVQALVAETDSPPAVRLTEHGVTADFLLPFDVRLPRLRWAGSGPVTITVGETDQRGLLHFSAEVAERRPDGAVVDISDVLSLLGRDVNRRTASMTSRAILFLGTICSRLPLEDVIAPGETPAAFDENRRLMLAWLLSILGLSFTPTDLDMLRVLGGGHAVPLWYLIKAAQEDPVTGLNLLRDRADLDEILLAGLAADLDNDEDYLILGTLLALDVQDRGGLKAALEIVCEQNGVDVSVAQEIRADAAITRLVGKGYLIESGDRLSSCSCVVTRALRRADPDEVLTPLVRRVDAELAVRDRVYGTVLEMAWHQHQADMALRSRDEQESRAHRTTRELMSSTTPFDLRALCQSEARQADNARDDVDVYWESGEGGRAWIAGPEIWVTCMIRELLTNAVSAAAGRGLDGHGAVWLEIRFGEKPDEVELIVSDDGPGFPDDFLEAFRARRPARRAGRPNRGNGLHLYRTYGESCGLRFDVGTRAGGGAVVRVLLPVVRGPESR